MADLEEILTGKGDELQGVLGNINARLEQLSAKMDQLHEDVVLSIYSPRSHSASQSLNPSGRPSAGLASNPSRLSFSSFGNRNSQEHKSALQMIPSDRLESIQPETSAKESNEGFSPKAPPLTMRDLSEDQRSSSSPPEAGLPGSSLILSPSRPGPVSYGDVRRLGPGQATQVTVIPGQMGVFDSTEKRPERRNPKIGKSVDLKVAWRLQARKQASEDIQLSGMDPMLRLVERTQSEHIWELLNDPNSSRSAWAISWVFELLVLVSVCVDYAALVDIEHDGMNATALAAFNLMADSLFLVEVLLRLLTAPSKAYYIYDSLNWADLLSACVLPFRIAALASNNEDLALGILLIVPLIRFLKLLRYFEVFKLLIVAFQNSLEALPVLSYFMALLVLFGANAIYMAEDRSNIQSIQQSMWLAVVTMTTVGYGDSVPKTAGGYFFTSVLTLASVWFLALPVGIIGYEFTSCWQSREHVLLITRARKCLEKWGYDSNSLSKLFTYVDSNNDGSLNMAEFLELMRQMRIGIDTPMAMALFQVFDDDSSGSISYEEFLRHIYPEEFVGQQFNKFKKEQVERSSIRVTRAMHRLERQVKG